MMDTYKSMHVMYNPSLYDVESFAKVYKYHILLIL